MARNTKTRVMPRTVAIVTPGASMAELAQYSKKFEIWEGISEKLAMLCEAQIS
jgi:hypothetical protein